MENKTEKQDKKWWRFRQTSFKDHGRIALLGLLLAGLKGQFPRPNFVIEILLNVLIIWGAIAGILWLKEKIKSRHKKV
jgi:hypothetical protein